MRPSSGARGALLTLLVAAGIACPAASVAVAEPPDASQTLCVLDFNRLGDDAGMDWLQRGLADMTITAMRRLGPYRVVEREHLRQLLAEHGLARQGITDTTRAAEAARLASAQLLLLGNFIVRGDRITIQTRLLRLSDQRVLAMAGWTGTRAAVLAAPGRLAQSLLRNLDQPVDAARLAGIEREIPSSIDVATAYYLGVGAFDDGHYPEALAHYLDAAASTPVARAQHAPFLESHRAVIRMYDLVDRTEHAVTFAHDVALRLEADRHAAQALEFYLAAAEKCGAPLEARTLAVSLLEHAVGLAKRSVTESAVSEARDALTQEASRLDERGVNGLQRRHFKHYRLLLRSFTWGLSEEPQLDENIDYFREDGHWTREPYPYPSTLMWLTRAQRMLARTLARAGDGERALVQYREIHDRMEFLAALPVPDLKRINEAIETEAHFVLLYHYQGTGSLVRDHAMARINRLNVLKPGEAFIRTAPHRDIDRRARVHSRYEGRAHEHFDFASPAGFELRSMTLTAQVAGLADFSIYLPQPSGWPPQYSLSKRHERFRFWKGTHRRKIALPPGTELVSMTAAWGGAMFDNTLLDVQYHRLLGLKGDADIVSWRLDFELAPRSGGPVAQEPRAAVTAADRRLMAHYASEDGWSHPSVLRDTNVVAYDGRPRVDVYAQDWLAFSVNGEIQIHRQDDPRVVARLPRTVNTPANEFDPSLVRTHEGGYALLWSRGAERRTAVRFVAHSLNLIEWQTPQRLAFEPPADTIRYTYATSEPLERSYNVCPVPGGYVMLLAQGYVRQSQDLRNWGQPRRVLPQDLLENRLIRTRDGRLWAAFETSAREQRPYTGQDALAGFFVIDGKAYQHLCEIHLASSRDGIHWSPAGHRTLEGQPSDLWVFPLPDERIAIAAQFNRLFVRWLTSSGGGELREVPSIVTLKSESQAVLFVDERRLSCVRPVFDYFDAQRSVVLEMSSKPQLERLLR